MREDMGNGKRKILITSIVCMAASLLGLLASASMTVAPGGEAWRRRAMFTLSVFFALWLALALWAKWRLGMPSAGSTASSRLVTAAVVAGGIIYTALVLLFTVG
jgi:hypothetical protein